MIVQKRAKVFTPNALPKVTYVDEHLKEKKKLLQENLEMGGAVVVISGPSKSGKTVFVESTVGEDNLVHVSGADINQADELWRRVFAKMEIPIPGTASHSDLVGGSASAGLEGAIPLLTKAKGSGSLKAESTQSRTADVRPDFLTLLVRAFRGTDCVVFIDDFHYISRQAQVEVAAVIKEAVRQGLRFVLASVTYHSDDVVIANKDLTGRMLKLDFDYWDATELRKIAVLGFEALNVQVPEKLIQTFASESAGSPQLMQSLCLNFCFEADIAKTVRDRRVITTASEFIDKVCKRTAQMHDFSSVIRAMKEGPKVRGTGRNSYVLKDGSASDVYPILVRAISQSPPELTLSYSRLLERVIKVCQNEHPQGSSVTGSCEHMSKLANAAAAAPLMEWDSENDVLDIRDPYLLFALRWG